MEYQNCPNCKAKIKTGVFSDTSIIHENKTLFINKYTDNSSEAYCSECYGKNILMARGNYIQEKNDVNKKLKTLLSVIPIITLQNPYKWDYKVIKMVTAQSVTGTGVISEFAASITDIFGMQSNRYNTKIKEGELLCATKLRLSAIELQANAIIATDIDYAEVGGDKGMLMVCMSGTAVKLNNVEILGDEFAEKFQDINHLSAEITELNRNASIGESEY